MRVGTYVEEVEEMMEGKNAELVLPIYGCD
jgi:hypothetical protein